MKSSFAIVSVLDVEQSAIFPERNYPRAFMHAGAHLSSEWWTTIRGFDIVCSRSMPSSTISRPEMTDFFQSTRMSPETGACSALHIALMICIMLTWPTLGNGEIIGIQQGMINTKEAHLRAPTSSARALALAPIIQRHCDLLSVPSV
ncbi:hypothetical protein CVT26_002614 [Gymnopilus dilepis]|uniref:Uncharacterized protein n=1 Tax=Gymnopilus dilepis TaxID=231916 RepID=A0A409VF65_9AGAR|nr:hypothetical protein CVT26_002614 [Gymnopilus dilepis]